MTPRDGDAFFSSAMTAGLFFAIFSSMARMKPRTSLRLFASRSTSDSLRIWRAAAISVFFVWRILARISFMGQRQCIGTEFVELGARRPAGNGLERQLEQIGRASWRERVCQCWWNLVGAGSL